MRRTSCDEPESGRCEREHEQADAEPGNEAEREQPPGYPPGREPPPPVPVRAATVSGKHNRGQNQNSRVESNHALELFPDYSG